MFRSAVLIGKHFKQNKLLEKCWGWFLEFSFIKSWQKWEKQKHTHSFSTAIIGIASNLMVQAFHFPNQLGIIDANEQ